MVAIPVWVLARHVQLVDGNDTGGLLDVRRLEVSGQDRPKWEFITFTDWSKERIWDRGFGLVYLDTEGGDRFDKYALIRSTGFSMEATLWRDRKVKSDVKIGKLDVWRRNGRSVTVQVPLSELDIPLTRTYFRWFTETLFSGQGCPQICIDRVPDAGAIEEPLVEPTPTTTPSALPTLTPTPTPTPTPTESP
ncbi:MAG: hypothetical protein H0U53_01095 [Actinobacteria bacterium]|nr:hypothetical protein [Actinomycetota bacterium]